MTESESTKAATERGKIYQSLLWYAFWFLLITCVYWPGLIVFPKRDHSIFMLGRFLFDSDLEWFLKTLNYARTRLLLPGDSFAFRPVHMFILGLEDIVFRYNLLAQGIISSALFSATATLLFALSKKISNSIFLAFAATSLWAFQLAGSEMLLWQHITPYIVLPGFFCAALLLVIDKDAGTKSFVIAGTFVFLAGLTYEIGGLIALSLAFFTYFSGAARRKKYVWTFALGGFAALSLSAFDYFIIQEIKSFTGTADIIIRSTPFYESLLPFTGAIGISSFAPSSVHVNYSENWFLSWDYLNCSKPLMFFGAISVIGIAVINVIQTLLSLRKSDNIYLNAVSIFALSLFFLAFGVCIFRIYTRTADYMFSAPYYFSFLSLSIALMITVIIARLNSKYLTVSVSSILCLLSLWHVNVLYSELNAVNTAKKITYNLMQTTREKILNDKSICFGGMDLDLMEIKYRKWTPLFQDISCSERSGTRPVYLSEYMGKSALSYLKYGDKPSPYSEVVFFTSTDSQKKSSGVVADLQFGHAFEVTLDKINSPSFIMKTNNGEKFGFSIDYNLIRTVHNIQETITNTILWNPGKFKTTYRVAFADDQVILFANGFLIGMLDGIHRENDSPIRLEIYSGTNDNVKVSKAVVATIPSKPNITFEPKYIY